MAPVPAGLLLFGGLVMGADTIPLQLSLGTSQQPPAPQARPERSATSLHAAGPAGGVSTKWFSVQRSFGVFTFARVGIQCADGGARLYFLLDASILLGPLTFTTQGLGIGSPLTPFTPTFHLDGLGLSFKQPPLEIEGTFLAVPSQQFAPSTQFQFDGFAVVKAASFTVAAVGSYAQLSPGDPSLFVLAQLDTSLGGTPAFFVVGLMAGFGYNRTLAIPAQDEVLDFPLLALGAQQDPSKVLAVLEGHQPATPGGKAKAWIAPQTGEYWLAIGVEFTSFELVRTQALAIGQFGHEFALALLGVSTLRLPGHGPDAESYAFVQLELEAVLKPSEGVLGLTALLSAASYVIAPACHLTGGFAFYLWFGANPHSGQFVITLGGYHPAFTPPPYFPVEPRLGLSWTVSDEISVKGDAYLALTTSCVMAGGGLEFIVQFANLRAWYTAQLDVLISWHPFFFLAAVGVSIGVSYKLDLGFVSKTISVSVGATVNLWGPPTGATVTVHLWVISFTVDVGARAAQGNANHPLDQADFAALLPASALCTVAATSGLMGTQPANFGGVSPPASWLVRASGFSFSTGSAIPVTDLCYGSSAGAEITQATGFGLNVRPMNLTSATATHTVRLTSQDGNHGIDLTQWTPTLVLGTVPQSLWGTPLATSDGTFTQVPQKADAALVADAPVGVVFTCPPPTRGPSPGVVPEWALAFDPVPELGRAPLDVDAAPDPTGLPAENPRSLALIQQIADGTPSAARTQVLEALRAVSDFGTALYAGPSSDLARLAAQVDDAFAACPLIAGSTGASW